MFRFRLAALALVCSLVPPSLQAADDVGTLIDRALAGDHRSDANRARDAFRHPKETLMFFGLRPEQTVVEIWPSAGWFTEVIAPVVLGRGKLYAARYAVSWEKAPEVLKTRDKVFVAGLAARPDVYGSVVTTELLAPDFTDAAPKGSADLVLTFRNVHNWAKAGRTDAMFATFHGLLRSGGILGVEEHRAKPGTSVEDQIRTGYMTEQYVIEAAERAGFRFAGKSEINANPKDTKDHPSGVWTLPPTLALGDKDREKYLAIGESDRMTIKFVKP